MNENLEVLLLNAFHGGSHRAFANSFSQHSRHRWHTMGLPAVHWKWRMRSAPLQFAEQLQHYRASNAMPDAMLVTDMLDLAALRGCVRDTSWLSIPTVLYFHENQFTYPASPRARPDMHYGYTNLQSALLADHVWFNSRFHRDEFLQASREFIRRMPDGQNVHAVEAIEDRSFVLPPGFDLPDLDARAEAPRGEGLTIAWASRWEFDKRPDLFYQLLCALDEAGLVFRLVLLGPGGQQNSEDYQQIVAVFGDRVDFAAGKKSSREAYVDWLCRADVLVSTAEHEFFGIAACEGAWCGAVPLLPKRLAYPEIFPTEVLYDNLQDAVHKLIALQDDAVRNRLRGRCRAAVAELQACKTVARMDDVLLDLVKSLEKE